MRYIFAILVFLSTYAASAQYWFGPAIGGQTTSFVYQEPKYKSDSFNVSSNYGMQYGMFFIYQASEKYAVQTELLFQKVRRTVDNYGISTDTVVSKTNYNFLSLPISLRWNFGGEPVHFYIAGGPVLSYWLGGSGKLYAVENQEFGQWEPYKFVFKQSKSSDTQRAVVRPNRVQYGLQVSTGTYFDLQSGGRLLFDLRYVFGHSNMAFNGNTDFKVSPYYHENFKFRNNTLSLSLSYLFMYDVQLQRKGMSTIDDSNQRKKKERRKNKRKRH